MTRRTDRVRANPDRWLGRTFRVVPDVGLPVLRLVAINDAGVTFQPADRARGWRFFNHTVSWLALAQLLGTVLEEC